MKEGSLKVVVAITEAYPTLLADLGGKPEGLRSDRLKLLAVLGLSIEGGDFSVSAPSTPAQSDPGNFVSIKPFSFAVVFNSALPRLHQAIESTPARLRAERVRVLAALGLLLEKGGLVAGASSVAAEGTHKPIKQHAKAAVQSIRKSESNPGGRITSIPDDQAHSRGEEPVSPQPVSLEVRPSPDEPTAMKKPDGDPNAVGKKVRNFAKLLGSLD